MSQALKRFRFEITLLNRSVHNVTATSPGAAIIVLWGQQIEAGHEDNHVVSIRQTGFNKELMHPARRELTALIKSQMPRIT